MKEINMKDYFSSPGTVSTWWREENWTPVLRSYFNEQLNYVSSLQQWEGKLVLDAGTGFGRFARALALKGAKVLGIDINPDMIEIASSNNYDLSQSITWQLGDIENLILQDESFDAVVCMETLMHIPVPSKAIAEFARVTRPGGIVVVGINNRFSLPYLVQAVQFHTVFYRYLRHRPIGPAIHCTATIGQLRSWMRDAKLKVQDEIGIGLLHPEVALTLWPGVSVNPVPPALSKWLLSIEKTHDLGRKWLKYAMKAVLVCAEKPRV